MGKSLITAVGLFAAALISCMQNAEPTDPRIYGPSYIAHLQLDSTELIVSEVINGLDVPWDLSVDPEGWLWVTEQRGVVTRVNPETGEAKQMLEIPEVYYRRSTGLFSKVLHPEFDQSPFVYLHYVYAETDTNLVDHINSRIVRYTFVNDTLINPKTILDNIPGRPGHNGSRMMICQDYKLWIGTGDIGRADLAQDMDSYSGKVLRMNLDGSVPKDNPFHGSRIWSIGHRNIQGITQGRDMIYISEHGAYTDDEVNLIVKHGNYGWPEVEGFCDQEHEIQPCEDLAVVEPIYAWTPTIATAGMEYYDHDAIPEWKNSLLIATLKGQSLRVLTLDDEGKKVTEYKIYFQKYFGRLRDIAVSDDGKVFLAVSNLDWHPRFQPWLYDNELPVENGDRIIMIEPQEKNIMTLKLESRLVLYEDADPAIMGDEIWNFQVSAEDVNKGETLFRSQCSSCHNMHGKGIEGYIPSLVNNDWVTDDKNRLINLILRGAQGQSDYIELAMPGFRHLEDEEVAAIVNYVRHTFGGKTNKALSADVYEARKGLE